MHLHFHFFVKKFAQLKIYVYLCTRNQNASLAQLARARDL